MICPDKFQEQPADLEVEEQVCVPLNNYLRWISKVSIYLHAISYIHFIHTYIQ